MKKKILLPILMASVLGMTIPAFAEETELASPPLSEEDRPELPPHVKKSDVVAVYAKPQAQPAPVREDAPEEAKEKKLDTIWIYYADNTFDQYADMDGELMLFSKGTYSLDGDFPGEGSIVINRTEKMNAESNALESYESSHEYELGTLGFDILAEDGVVAMFEDPGSVEYTDLDGITRFLDTFWIFFEDGTFQQYDFLDDEMSLYSSGTYEFNDVADFHMPFGDQDHGTITLRWETSLDPNAQLEKTYDLNSFGMDCLYELYEE